MSNNNNSQPGPSGVKPKKSDDKKEEEASQRPILISEKQPKPKKKVKINSLDIPQHQRRSSADQPLRYRLTFRPEGTQQSHSIRNVLPKRSDPPKPLAVKDPVASWDEPQSVTRDHHDAADFYVKSLPFFTCRESLLEMRACKKLDRRDKDHQHKQHAHRSSSANSRLYHVRRCRKCLEIKDACICDTMEPKPLKSDWAVVVLPDLDKKKTFTNGRLDWLEEIENNEVDTVTLIEEKFDIEREVCCFPFNTFRIFSKRDIKNVDYYIKDGEQ